MRLSASGEVIWRKSLGGAGSDWPASVDGAAGGGRAAAGWSGAGEGLRRRRLGGGRLDCEAWPRWGPGVAKGPAGGEGAQASSARQTSDGGYALAGRGGSNGGGSERSGAGGGFAAAAREAADGGFIAAGASNSSGGDFGANHGGADAWAAKLGPAGALKWLKTFGGGKNDFARDIRQTAGGGYIFAGGSESGFAQEVVLTDDGGRALGGEPAQTARTSRETMAPLTFGGEAGAGGAGRRRAAQRGAAPARLLSGSDGAEPLPAAGVKIFASRRPQNGGGGAQGRAAPFYQTGILARKKFFFGEMEHGMADST